MICFSFPICQTWGSVYSVHTVNHIKICAYSTHTRYKSGLLALNGLLCVHDQFPESDVAAQYGSDAGLAFWLVGELNAQLNQSKEAAKFFKAALKYNPFLWTAYQSLCEMGNSLSLSLSSPPLAFIDKF